MRHGAVRGTAEYEAMWPHQTFGRGRERRKARSESVVASESGPSKRLAVVTETNVQACGYEKKDESHILTHDEVV